jgi:hypothetical protein
MKKLVKLFVALGLVAAVGTLTIAADANAGARQCWRGVGGWYCN